MGERRTRNDDDPDDDLFRREVADVMPLPPRGDREERRTPPPPPARRDDDAAVMDTLDGIAAGEIPFEISDTGEYVEGLAQGIDRKHLGKLKKGEYSWQRHLDLHGHTREAARAAVAGFLDAARRDGLRCVLIVHGRGHRSPDGPVLKEALKAWLARGRLGRAVMAFATAQAADGGAGAMYVLLRR